VAFDGGDGGCGQLHAFGDGDAGRTIGGYVSETLILTIGAATASLPVSSPFNCNPI